MNKDDIITLPNEHLRARSKKITAVTPEVKKLIDDMMAATLDWEASREHEISVALAAVQVDKLFKIVVIRNNFDDRNDHTFTTFINPVITKYEGVIKEDYEGCLSVTDVYGWVPRSTKVRVKAMDETGKDFRVTAEGFLARIFQHEIDHINGILFIDHIKNKPKAFYKLNSEGKLEEQDYDKDVKNNSLLW